MIKPTISQYNLGIAAFEWNIMGGDFIQVNSDGINDCISMYWRRPRIADPINPVCIYILSEVLYYEE